jgi:nitric oxide reductase activation protein
VKKGWINDAERESLAMLCEARLEGIHPFCITIDVDAGEFLSHRYGQVNYVVVDDVRHLAALCDSTSGGRENIPLG